MNESPLFSILIANFNNGSFLMDAIDSVRNQTYSNWEIILVDDASTDSSLELYKQLEQDKRIHLFFNEENKGCGYTKHRCVELASGTICGFLDPDDTLAEDALKKMVRIHEDNPNVSLVFSAMNIVDNGLKIVKKGYYRPKPNGESFLKYPYWNHFASFKRSLYQNTEGIDPIARRAVDDDLYYRLEEVGDVMYIKDALYNYRFSTGSNISQGKNEYKAFVWHLRATANACRRRNMEDSIEGILAEHINSVIVDIKKTEADRIRKTKPYRIGRLLLSPLYAVKSLFGTK